MMQVTSGQQNKDLFFVERTKNSTLSSSSSSSSHLDNDDIDLVCVNEIRLIPFLHLNVHVPYQYCTSREKKNKVEEQNPNTRKTIGLDWIGLD